MTPDSSFPAVARRRALAGLVACAVAPVWFAAAPSAHAAVLPAPQACHFDADDYWRSMPVTLTGTLVEHTTGNPIAPGTTVPVGTKVRLQAPTVDVDLGHWAEMFQFAFDAGYIAEGAGSLPIEGWVALEATNSTEGVTAPISFLTTATTFGAMGSSSATFNPAAIPEPVWTAAGGTLGVRQAPATTMAPIPVGRTNNAIAVNGTLFIRMQMDDGLRIRVDCQAGASLEEGAGHTTLLPPTLDAVRSPGYAGSLDGTPWTTRVDAEVTNATLARATTGVATIVNGTSLTLRLDAAQSTALLGSSGSVDLSAALTLHGSRSAEGPQARVATTTVTATGAAQTVNVPVPASTWTPTGTTGVDLRVGDELTVTATVGGVARVLTLDRVTSERAAGNGYPFARIIGPDPRDEDAGTPGGGGTVTTPPTKTPPVGPPPPGFTPPPPPLLLPPPNPGAAVPKATKVRAVQVSTGSLRRSKGRVSLKLLNKLPGATSGKFRIVTRGKYRVGKAKKAKVVTVVSHTRFRLKGRKSATFKPRLSTAATQLLRSRKRLAVTVTVVPTKTKTQTTVTKRLTLHR